jgi:hypothetical protein
VFRHYDNSKRAIALLGVLLALSPGAQHAHLLCELSGCSDTSGVHACDAPDCSQNKKCSHTHVCHAHQHAAATLELKGDHHEHDGSCPCPPGCFCQQAPQPLDLPKDASRPFKLLLRSAAPALNTTIAADQSNVAPSSWGRAIGESSASSVHRCAQLCRFLI